MREIPGVRAASVARVALMTGNARVSAIAIEGRSDNGDRTQSEGGGFNTRGGRTVLANVVGPDFFATLGISLLRGRDFMKEDGEDRPLVAIINETMAKQFFPQQDPLGRRLTTGFTNASGQWTEIVGIVRDSKYAALSEPASPIVYMPIAQRHETGVTLYVRASGEPASLVAQIRRELQSIEPNLPVPDIRIMAETIGASLYAPRMGAVLLTVFGGLALLLASLGVYGVLAFSIARRTREIGIRMALGADRRRVFALVIREGMTLVGIGVALGLAAGFYASAAIGRFLYDVSPRDVVTFAGVPCVLAAVALVACYLPARRAMRVDPMTALRES
jgi:putative ABC transport system permease protein